MREMTLKLLACSASLLLPFAAEALGLSDIELGSYLNQSLDARIVLVGATPAELESLTVTVTGAAGSAQRHFAVKQSVVRDADGGAYIHLTSRESVREPVLGLVVSATWNGGRVYREYALILDMNRND
jgi:pilus assembly protein FimV